jgi:2-polyprenyl-3-methyl-5-hydroxy-6-metoxy-1,4-benzoquinol methylase
MQDFKPTLETVSCNLCQSNQTRPYAWRMGMQVVQCLHCGLVYVNPRFDARSLHLHYNSGHSSRMQYYRDVECADRRTFCEVLQVARQMVPNQGTLLDIGPNIGTCLALAREQGWKVVGIEINAEAAAYCRNQRRLPVITGTLDTHPFQPSGFDVVLMGDVIEHLSHPLQTMGQVQRLLRPGGIVVISTPNIGGWAARVLQIKPEEHLYYFTPKTMRALLSKAGLEIVRLTALDRYHNFTAMTHSTTFGGLFQMLGPVFDMTHKVFGDIVLKLPLRENLLVVGRKPAQALARAA